MFQGLNIGKWSTGKHCDEVAIVKNVKTDMCQKGGTLSLNRSLLMTLVQVLIWGMECRGDWVILNSDNPKITSLQK